MPNAFLLCTSGFSLLVSKKEKVGFQILTVGRTVTLPYIPNTRAYSMINCNSKDGDTVAIRVAHNEK
jgi:hypothetical protein